MIVLPAAHGLAAGAATATSAAHRSMLLLTSMSEPILPSSSSSSGDDDDGRISLDGSDSSNSLCSDDAPLKPLSYERTLPPSSEDLPDLFDDLLIEILSKLNGSNRQAVSGCCKRLRDLARPTFTHLTLPVPPITFRSEPDPSVDAFAAAAGARMATMASITLHLPQPPASGAADNALDRFLSLCLSSCPGGLLQADTLRIKTADSQASQSNPTPYQISHEALLRLSSAAPRLRRLSLPLLSTAAAAALPHFSSHLVSLSLTVSDSPSLDHALQLTALRQLSISTRKGLLYLVLSQRQISNLAQMSSLQTLSLNNVLLNDCRTTWEPLSALTALRELSVSSPLSAERLTQLPASLRVLQLPFFAGSLDVLTQLAENAPDAVGSCGFGQLAELRCRQAFTEQDLKALSCLCGLRTLQCDTIVIMDAAAQAAQAALARSAAANAAAGGASAADVAALSALPVLRSVHELRLTGFHGFNGLLGLMFPNLQTLKMTSVTVPRPVPARVAPLPCLRSLTFPSSCVLPEMLAACPELLQLSVPGINCQQRLEELLLLPASLPLSGLAPPGAAGCGYAAPRTCWPAKLTELSLGFSSSVRFRPKQVVAAFAAVPEWVSCSVRRLALRDKAQGTGPGRVVDDSVVAAALRVLPQLESLRLEDSGLLSGDGLVTALKEARSGLVAVAVVGCPRVERSQAERAACALGRPWLEVTWQGASK